MDEEQAVGIVFLLDRAAASGNSRPSRPSASRLRSSCFPRHRSRRSGASFRSSSIGRADRCRRCGARGEVGLVAAHARIGRRPLAGDDRQREGVEHRRVHRGVPRGGDRLGRRAGEALLEMQLDRPMPAGGEQRVGEPLPPVRCSSDAGSHSDSKPCMKCPASLRLADQKILSAGAPGRSSDEHGAGRVSEKCRVPAMRAPATATDHRREREREILRCAGHPVEEGLPDRLGLLLVEALERPSGCRGVLPGRTLTISPQCGLNRLLGVEFDEPADQPAKGRVGRGLDRRCDDAEERRAVRACAASRRVTTPKLPPPPPFSAQNRSGLVQALAIRTSPSAVTISASSKLAAAVP